MINPSDLIWDETIYHYTIIDFYAILVVVLRIDGSD